VVADERRASGKGEAEDAAGDGSGSGSGSGSESADALRVARRSARSRTPRKALPLDAARGSKAENDEGAKGSSAACAPFAVGQTRLVLAPELATDGAGGWLRGAARAYAAARAVLGAHASQLVWFRRLGLPLSS
jgi:hypothetical protein